MKARIGYFGKLPGHADFVRSAHEARLLAGLDEWISAVMAALPDDPRWKTHYDALAPLHFAFAGPRHRHAVAGHLVRSKDQSGRRFPFVLAHTVEVADPRRFVSACPLAFAPLWGSFAALACAADPLAAAGSADGPQPNEGSHAALEALLDTCTIGALAGLLGQAGVRRLLLALGLVLQPLLRADAAPGKDLVLPLPANETARYAIAAFWLGLVEPFLASSAPELAIFVTVLDERPVLVLGFAGASARTLQALIDPVLRSDVQLTFHDTSWVDGCCDKLRGLAGYLDQPGLPLRHARELFLQTFTGGAE
ncbi:MAG: type VI secretion system-associated protein TagF [Telluria sp.]